MKAFPWPSLTCIHLKAPGRAITSLVSWTPWGVSCPLDSFSRRLRVERDKTVSTGPAQKEIAPAKGLGLGGRSGSNFKI